MGWLIDLIIFLVVAALVLMVVDRMNLGISVGGFMNAVIAAAAIAVTSAVVLWLLVDVFGLSLANNLLGLIVGILVAALILWLAAKFIPGYSTDGFTGAIIGAIAIGVIYWLLNWLLEMLGLGGVDSPVGQIIYQVVALL